jgi:hypothetical protein
MLTYLGTLIQIPVFFESIFRFGFHPADILELPPSVGGFATGYYVLVIQQRWRDSVLNMGR